MANFSFKMDINSIFPPNSYDEKVALEMIEAGQEVMQKSIQSAARKHKKTGSMASSAKCSKPVINKTGDAVGRVKFYGKDENGMQNWSKAIWLEYGTVHQRAQPFVRPAIKGCEKSVKSAMEKVFKSKMEG